jgi:hypothetical protein
LDNVSVTFIRDRIFIRTNFVLVLWYIGHDVNELSQLAGEKVNKNSSDETRWSSNHLAMLNNQATQHGLQREQHP